MVLETVPFVVQPGAEDRRNLHAVLGAAVVAAPLRLRDARREVRAHRGRKPQAQVHGGGRGRAAAQGHQWRQPAQILSAGELGLSWVHWAESSFVPRQVDSGHFSQGLIHTGRDARGEAN